MPAQPSNHTVNRLMAGLPRREADRLLEHGKLSELSFGTSLCEPDTPFRHVYFPLSSFISLVAPIAGHKPLEMGLIGREGMLGATLALGVNMVPLRAVVQGPGQALCIPAKKFTQSLHSSPVLLSTLQRYVYVLMAQLSQTAACTRFHHVEARLARWLLMTHDRAHADRFHLTHDFLADMLGVRRSAVSIAAARLQRRGFISYTRGDIRILNRKGLESSSCECYRAVVNDYEDFLP